MTDLSAVTLFLNLCTLMCSWILNINCVLCNFIFLCTEISKKLLSARPVFLVARLHLGLPNLFPIRTHVAALSKVLRTTIYKECQAFLSTDRYAVYNRED
jgi:hypothetical protein